MERAVEIALTQAVAIRVVACLDGDYEGHQRDDCEAHEAAAGQAIEEGYG